MKADRLQRHILSTYTHLRYGVALAATAFPLILVVWGLHHDVSVQDSMSAYYWAPDPPFPPMRPWFVGILFGIGLFLFLYKGFSRTESMLLNFAAVCAFGLAHFPMEWNCQECSRLTLHGTFAVLLFLCLALVCWLCAKDTLDLIKDERRRRIYRGLYHIAGIAMAALPLTAFGVVLVLGHYNKVTLAIEWAGIWAFAGYWLTKSIELAQTGAEELAAGGQIATQPHYLDRFFGQ